jgi:hypothetical protein
MSRHLSPEEIVDAVDGVLQATRRGHLERCAECRQEIEAIGTLMTDVAAAGEMPAPSPLFWDHFPGRVLSAVERAPARRPGGWRLTWPVVAMIGAAMVLIAVGLVSTSITPSMPAVLQPIVESAPPPIAAPAPDTVAGPGRVAALEGPSNDDASPAAARSWNRMVTAGRDVSAEDVLGVAPTGPGTAVLIEDLSQRELQEFARLLRAQMGGRP